MHCHNGRFNVTGRTGKWLSETLASCSFLVDVWKEANWQRMLLTVHFASKVCEFTKSGELDNNVIQILWERFAMKIPNTTTSESRGAVILLSMAAG